MTDASCGYRSSHSSAASRLAPHFTPTDGVSPDPKNAKILPPTLATTSPSHGSSCQAPGLARQYASSSSQVMRHIVSRRHRRYAALVSQAPVPGLEPAFTVEARLGP